MRLLLVGAAAPAIFTLVDHALLSRLQMSIAGAETVALTLLVFVAQIGLMGWLCGRLLINPWWRWGLYLWSWILVDLQLVSATVFAGGGWGVSRTLPAALFAAQIGLTIVWAILGDTPWPIRLPACLVLGTLLAMPMHLGYGLASEMFPVQLAALGVLCLVLRWRGFRLQRAATPENEQAANTVAASGAGNVQFSLRHVLIWTTSLAIVLGALRAFNLLSIGEWLPYYQHGFTAIVAGGLLLACAFIVALWASLGSGPWWLRFPVLLFALLGIGFVLGVIQFCINASPRLTYAELWSWRQEFWTQDSWYIAWAALTGGLLAASLVILRVIGYRLVRPARSLHHAPAG